MTPLEVVHGYLGILSQQYTWSHEVPVVVLPCAVASHWKRGEYDEWLFEDIKLSESRFVLLPVNMSNSHWFLVVADMNTRELHVLDSMSNEERRKEFFEHWRQFLTERSQHNLDDDLLFNWTLGNLSSNQQVGSNDCGVFVLMNAEALLAGSHIGCLRQYHVPMFRRYALARIIKRARKYDEQVCDLPFCRNEGYSHWVQCERCQAWCHTSCAGIVQEEALDADNVHHVCWICRAV